MFNINLSRCTLKAPTVSVKLSCAPTPKTAPALLAQTRREALAGLEQRCNPVCDLSQQTLDFILQESARQENKQKFQENLEKSKKLETLMLSLLQSGHIDLAMLLFAQIESNEAQSMTGALTQQLQQAQAKRRELSGQMGQVPQGQQNSQSQLSSLQSGLQEVGDTLQMLTTLIKDINEQKNKTLEFANNFLNSEHQTTMSLIRGMRG